MLTKVAVVAVSTCVACEAVQDQVQSRSSSGGPGGPTNTKFLTDECEFALNFLFVQQKSPLGGSKSGAPCLSQSAGGDKTERTGN